MFRKNGFRHLLCAVILVLLCKMCASLPSVGVDEQGLKYYNIYIIESPCFAGTCFLGLLRHTTAEEQAGEDFCNF